MQIRTHPSTKRSKMVCLIVTRRELGQSRKGSHPALLKCCSALQKCRRVLLDAERSFVFGCVLDSLFRVFLTQSLYLDVFSSLVYDFFFKIFFLDNLGFFRNNYLVDKYPKINLDKVQIIHNFIVIQSSLLFL